jgi:hypothetical protein
MKPILIEIVTNVLTSFGHCSRCDVLFRESGVGKGVNREDIEEYPQDLKEDVLKLSEWIQELGRLYKHRIVIRFIDAKSFAGIYRSLIHRIRRYPTFIVEKKDVVRGWDREKLENFVDAHIKGQRA